MLGSCQRRVHGIAAEHHENWRKDGTAAWSEIEWAKAAAEGWHLDLKTGRRRGGIEGDLQGGKQELFWRNGEDAGGKGQESWRVWRETWLSEVAATHAELSGGQRTCCLQRRGCLGEQELRRWTGRQMIQVKRCLARQLSLKDDGEEEEALVSGKGDDGVLLIANITRLVCRRRGSGEIDTMD
ncbi:predicted protein [Uncinocarpus reesii 1704]|uniref:Uncharacterized protein n=1 Tax=Uncinocarpus reesii (strain UAMH 1704) TaxID=336963 RepID=C4JL38_UNCRE|nr:uncharacterized protein UREG_00253 [Uncinocarpus reesii 1704]EEP75407.1 predicted protein [Uncinocarpus reesii 1704]